MSSTSNTIRRIFQEATHLTHQFYRHRPTSIIQTQQILQQTVLNGASGTSATSNNASNSLAMTLVKVDKEIVYMKYEGLSQHFTKRFQDSSTMKRKMFNLLLTADTCSTGATTTATASTSSSTNRSTNTSNQRKARIAFMITKQQKQILSQRFHYTPTMIKTLKPTEALLIIENGLHAYDYDKKARGAEKVQVQLEGVQERRKLWKTKLDALVKENEALVERQQEEHQKEQERLEKLQEQEDVQMETEEETKMYMYEVIEQVTLPSASSTSTSTALSTALSTEISTSSTIFTSEVVLALYKTEEEA